MKINGVSTKIVKDGGLWYVVSAIYEPVTPGSVGSGIKWLPGYFSRERARKAQHAMSVNSKG